MLGLIGAVGAFSYAFFAYFWKSMQLSW